MILFLLACQSGDADSAASTGVTRAYDMTVTAGGTYELKMAGGGSMGSTDAYMINNQFLAPTLEMDLGDSVNVTLHNATDVSIGLHPHGLHYDKDNEGVSQLAPPGGEVTYHWEATNGPGTFPYHSHQMDADMVEYQAEAGVLGTIVIRDPEEWAAHDPDHMINFTLMNTYLPWTTVDMTGMGDTGEHEDEAHNHTMVVQEVRDGVTVTQDDLISEAKLGETVRVNLVAFGEDFHTFHTHGYTWNDPWTGRTLDTITLGPAESYYFYLTLDNPGKWMTHCHVDDHMHMMTDWIDVTE